MAVNTFVKGDLIRTEDPAFEMEYQPLDASTPPAIGVCGVLDAGDDLVIADGSAAQTKKIGVRTSFVDAESSNVGVLYRGYIVQLAQVDLQPTEFVKPDSTGEPTLADPGLATDEELIYGVVVGKANTNDQTTRVTALAQELVIIKVGDW